MRQHGLKVTEKLIRRITHTAKQLPTVNKALLKTHFSTIRTVMCAATNLLNTKCILMEIFTDL